MDDVTKNSRNLARDLASELLNDFFSTPTSGPSAMEEELKRMQAANEQMAKDLDSIAGASTRSRRIINDSIADLVGSVNAPTSGAAGNGTASGPAGNGPATGTAGNGPATGTAGNSPATGTAGNGPASGSAGAVDTSDNNKTQAATSDNTPDTQEEQAPAEPETDPMEDLQALTGLTSLKKDVEELINLVKMQKMREERGMKVVAVSKHLVFTGNPGTGKTTVARILARLYRQIGVLSKGQLVEVDRAGLVAGYVGQTALKTTEKIKEAMGGILFIDEAYTLAKEGNDFGQEAIDTVLKAMEDNRDDFVVIVAGYTDLMQNFINSNPGLKSRFNKYFNFPDYNADELETIFYNFCAKNDYLVEDAAKDEVHAHLQMMVENKDDNFANARDVRNYFEHIINLQASRVVAMEDPTDDDIRTITEADLHKLEGKAEEVNGEIPTNGEEEA